MKESPAKILESLCRLAQLAQNPSKPRKKIPET